MAKNLELEIGGIVHQFRAGFDFIDAVEPLTKQTQNGYTEEVGLNKILYGLQEGDARDLATALYYMNKGDDKRLSMKAVQQYIEDHEDVEKLFTTVKDFLLSSNCTKLKLKKATLRTLMIEKNLETSLGGNSGTNA